MLGKVLVVAGAIAWVAALGALALVLIARIANIPLLVSFEHSYEAFIYPSQYVIGVMEGQDRTETVLNLRLTSDGHPVAYAVAKVSIRHTDGSKSTVWIGPTSASGRASAWVPLLTSRAGIVEFRAEIIEPYFMPYEMTNSMEVVFLK